MESTARDVTRHEKEINELGARDEDRSCTRIGSLPLTLSGIPLVHLWISSFPPMKKMNPGDVHGPWSFMAFICDPEHKAQYLMFLGLISILFFVKGLVKKEQGDRDTKKEKHEEDPYGLRGLLRIDVGLYQPTATELQISWKEHMQRSRWGTGFLTIPKELKVEYTLPPAESPPREPVSPVLHACHSAHEKDPDPCGPGLCHAVVRDQFFTTRTVRRTAPV